MADAVVGALRVILGADTVKFEEGLSNAERLSKRFSANVGEAFSRIARDAAKLSVAVIALGAFVKHNAEAAAKLKETSERLGISAQSFQELSFAAKSAGIEQEEFTKAMEQFNRRMGDFTSGVSKGDKALLALGLNLEQIKAAKPDEQFKIVAEAVKRLASTQDQAAVAADLFGKAGVRLLNVMQQGRAGLEQFAQRARDLGIILSDEVINRAAKADDVFDELGAVFKATGIKLAAEFLPAMLSIQRIIASQGFQDAIASLTGNLRSLFQLIEDHGPKFVAFGAALVGLKVGAIIGSTFGPAGTAVGGLTGALVGLTAALEAMGPLDDKVASFGQRFGEWGDAIAKVTVNGRGLSDVAKLTEENARITEAHFEKLIGLVDGLRTPYENYKLQLEQIATLQDRIGLSAETAAELSKRAAEKAGQAWHQVAGSIVSDFTSAFQNLAKVNEDFAEVAKAVAIVEAVINTYTAATKALAAYPPPFSYIAAAAAIAKGLSMVAVIRSQKTTGFAEGGSFRVGGVGGQDSKLVSMALSPGEMVDVKKPGQRGGDVVQLDLRLPTGKQIWTAETVGDLVDAMNRLAPDGYVLKMVS